MSILALKSSKSFRQFRVAVFATAIFLRLAWAFVLALNAFSLTTRVDSTHQGVSIFIFAVNATAFFFIAMVGCLEVFKFKIASWTSRVAFELGWMALFWILEAAGATIFTILRRTFHCDIILRIQGDATGAVFASQSALSGKRPTTPSEAATCHTFDQIVFIGSWAVVGISFLYLAYFFLLCQRAYRRDSSIWHTRVNKVDWSITSAPTGPDSEQFHPEKIQRPSNPHLSLDYDDSTLSLPPVFINPFDPSSRKDSYESSVFSTKGLDRHKIMAQYQPPSFEPSFKPLVLPNIVSHHQRMQSSGSYSALGLEGMDRPATEYRKSRPTLSIHVPTHQAKVVPIGAGEEDYARIGRTMSMALVASPRSENPKTPSEEPCAAIGRHMSMPFASPTTSDESPVSQSSLGKITTTSMKALGSHISIMPGSQDSFTPSDSSMIQTVTAANGYPTVQHTPKRQSTLVRQDSMNARRAMRFTHHGEKMRQNVPIKQRGPILPLHYQDLSRNNVHQQQQAYGWPSHYRSKSDGEAMQSSYTPWESQRVSTNTWHGQRPAHPAPTQRTYAPVFRPPPPPSHSPVYPRGVSPYGPAHSRTSLQGHTSHSRSSSTPSFQIQYPGQPPLTEPIPALLDALRPVLRHSGNYSYSSAAPSPYQSRPNSAIRPPFHENPFGPVRSAPLTPTSIEEMNVSIRPETDSKSQTKRSSRLRKSVPRNM